MGNSKGIPTKIISKLMKKIQINDFIKNSAKIITGDLIVKIIGFLSIALLARIYSPSDFGIMELIISIQLLILTFASMKYEQAVIVAKNDIYAFNIFILSLIILVITSVISLGCIFILTKIFDTNESIKKMGIIVFLIPLLVLSRGFKDNIVFWFQRKKRFGRTAISEIATKISDVAFKISLSFLGVFGLFWGTTSGFIIASFILIFYLFKMDSTIFRKVSVKQMISLFKEYRRFPIFLIPSHFFRMISERLPALILTPFFGFQVIGFYAISFKLFNEPMSILGKSIGNVFYQEASNRKNKGINIEKLTQNVFEKLFIFSFLPILVITINGKILVTFFLGQDWYTAGFYTQLLAPMMFFRFISNPLSYIYNITQRQNIDMIFNSLLVITGLASLIIGGIKHNITLSLLLFSISNSIIYLISILTVLRISEISFIKMLNRLKFHLSASIAFALFLIFFLKYCNSEILNITVPIIILGFYYSFVVYEYLFKKG